MGKDRRDPIAPDKRARPKDLEYLAKLGLKFRRARDNGAMFTRAGETPFGIEEVRKHFEIDGLQVFKANLKDQRMLVVDIDRPDLPLGRALEKEFKLSGTYGCESRTIGFHFYLRGGAWLDKIVGEPDIRDENGEVIAEMKKNWITLYRPAKDNMPILDASDPSLSQWRGLIEKAMVTRPPRQTEIGDVEKAIADWESRLRALPEGNHNNGFSEILAELKSSLWAKGQRDFALHIGLRLKKVYDAEVSPGDTSFPEERLRDYWFPVRQKDDVEAMPSSEGKGKKEKKEKKPKPGMESVVNDYVFERFGGWDGLHLIVKNEGKADVKMVLGWEKRTGGGWSESRFINMRDSLVGEIYDQYCLKLHEWGHDSPSLLQHDKYKQAILKYMVNKSGETQEFLNDFDSPASGRFLFGEKGVCEVVCINPGASPDERRFKLVTGGKNRPEYKLRRDIVGRLATDEEYARDLPVFMEECSKYFHKFDTDSEGSHLGNWLMDGLQLHLASGFVDMQLRPLGVCWGTGNNGKSNFWRYICMALGPQVAFGNLDESTFTDGSGSVTTGPRLAGHRAKMMGPLLCVVPEAPMKAALDSGFIKRMTSKGEVVPVGGMYKEDINIDLECVAFMSTNNVPIIYDQKKGMHRRLYLYPFLAKFPKKLKSQAYMDGIFLPLLPTIRRFIFEGIRRLVEVHHCVLPEQHSSILAIRKEFDEVAQSDIKSELSKCFRVVEDTGDKTIIDYYYQKRRARQGFVGGETTEERGVALDMNTCYFGIMLAVKAIIKSCSLRQTSYSQKKIKEILQELDFEFNGSIITNIVHTDHLVELIATTFGEERVPHFIKCMYRHYDKGSGCRPFELKFDRELPEGVAIGNPLPPIADVGGDGETEF